MTPTPITPDEPRPHENTELSRPSIATRKVGDESIYVVDALLSDVEVSSLSRTFLDLPFERRSVPHQGRPYVLFGQRLDPDKITRVSPICERAGALVHRLFSEPRLELYRTELNLTHYGDVEIPHVDAEPHYPHVTFVYYANEVWNYDWGGETVFYDQGDAVTLVSPKPGRAVLFRGRVEHKGMPPVRLCYESRWTLALKFRPVDTEGSGPVSGPRE